MYLKALEIQGFKSFPDKVKLSINKAWLFQKEEINRFSILLLVFQAF